MNDCEAAIEETLTCLKLGDMLLALSASMATFAVNETRRQCVEGQCLARIVHTLDAERAKMAADALETVT